MKSRLFKRFDRYIWRISGYELEFSTENGALLALSRDDLRILDGDTGLAPVVITVDGVGTVNTGRDHLWNLRDTIPVARNLKFIDLFVDESHDALHVLREGDGWQTDESYRYNAQPERLERELLLRWTGREECLLRWVELRMPTVASEECVLELPGYSDVLHERCASLPTGRLNTVPDDIDKDGANWRPGVLAATYPQGNMVSWLYGEDMPAFWQIYRGNRGTWLEQKWYCCARMQPGQEMFVGTQYITAGRRTLAEGLADLPPFWEEVDIRLRQPTPEWAKEAFIYEVHIGEKSFSNGRTYTPYPQVADLIADLDRIQDLGFTVIELMPRFPFPGYMVHDYFDVGVCYAPEEEMHALVKAVHARGMHIFLDVIMHGVVDKAVRSDAIYDRHPLLDEHPEFFSYAEDGRVNRTYTWSFDHANPELRTYIQKVFCFYVRELDVDGFRVDALTWNYFPNWRKGLPYPAYKSIDGSLDMFTAVRDAVWEIKPDVAFYSESTGPLMARCYDLSYVYDEIWMYECLMPPVLPNLPPKMHLNRYDNGTLVDGRGAAEWLDLRQRVLPKGWIKAHQADSHDSHEWRGLGAFRREYAGLQQSRALFAYCCFVEGAVMNFAGGERESEEIYRDLIHKRKQYPALQKGSCDYLAVTSENRALFAPLRCYEGQRMIPVINFSAAEAHSELDIRGIGLAAGKTYCFTELYTGKRFTAQDRQSLPADIGPYAYQLWCIEEKD